MTAHAKPVDRRVLDLRDPSLLVGQAYVAGEWIDAPDGKTLPVTDPFDGALILEVPDLGPEAARRAIDTAHAVQKEWAKRTAKERSAVLRRWYDLIIANADDLALILTTEQGKPLAEAKGEVISNAAYIEWFAEEAKRIDGDIVPAARGDQRILVLKQPVGVCAAITPWNFPNGMITRKAGPALAAGCTAVLRPAKHTPLTAVELYKVFDEVGFPKGVVNLITSSRASEIGDELLENPLVRKITFTGSTEVGKQLMRGAAEQLKRVSLELGGKSASIILPDADLAATVAGLRSLSLGNNGESCVAHTRVLAPRDRYEEVVDALAAMMDGLRVGDPADPETFIGPMVRADQQQRVRSYIETGIAEGARLVTGGPEAPEGLDGGHYVRPTLFADVDSGMRIAREEIFGPVLVVIPFTDEVDAVRIANDSEYGLAGSVWTADVEQGMDVARRVRTGTYGVNQYTMDFVAPFGGYKASGMGREWGVEGIEEFLETKMIAYTV